jgi:acetoin utilization protein AcuB
MIVRHWMTAEVVTIAKQASIQEAMAQMRQYSIRHLPVVDADRQLMGWVSDSDLRGALIASMIEELTVEVVMIHKPHTATPEMALEEAARLILEERIGGLPVVEGRKLVGIITVVDILAAFITIMGVVGGSSRVDVKIPAHSNALDRITNAIQTNQAEILSICHLPLANHEDQVYSFRLKKCDTHSIVKALKEKGFEVVSTT